PFGSETEIVVDPMPSHDCVKELNFFIDGEMEIASNPFAVPKGSVIQVPNPAIELSPCSCQELKIVSPNAGAESNCHDLPWLPGVLPELIYRSTTKRPAL